MPSRLFLKPPTKRICAISSGMRRAGERRSGAVRCGDIEMGGRSGRVGAQGLAEGVVGSEATPWREAQPSTASYGDGESISVDFTGRAYCQPANPVPATKSAKRSMGGPITREYRLRCKSGSSRISQKAHNWEPRSNRNGPSQPWRQRRRRPRCRRKKEGPRSQQLCCRTLQLTIDAAQRSRLRK